VNVSEQTLLSNRKRLLRTAYRIVGSADAEDVVQDAFERAWRTTSFRANADLRPWLSRIARNAAFNVLRRRVRTITAYERQRDIESAEASALRHERIAAIDVALGELPVHQRRAIVLHDVAGFSSREIAQLCGIEHNTVRTRLFRARRAMRRALDGETAMGDAGRPARSDTVPD
jgi:RNA polymerase sigma-70 factor, ECF subfamily